MSYCLIPEHLQKYMAEIKKEYRGAFTNALHLVHDNGRFIYWGHDELPPEEYRLNLIDHKDMFEKMRDNGHYIIPDELLKTDPIPLSIVIDELNRTVLT